MGGPTVKSVAEQLRRVILGTGFVIALCAGISVARAQPAPSREPTPTPVRLRITWGGGKPAARVGQIELVDPGTPPQAVEWRLLSADPAALATMHAAGGTIEIHEPRGLDMNGVEIAVTDWRRARLRVRLARRDTGEQPVVFDGPVVGLLATAVQQPLDTDANRLSIGRAPGDELRVEFAPGESALRRSGQALALSVHPLVAGPAASAAAYELTARVRRSGAPADTHVETVAVQEAGPAEAGVRECLPLRLVLPVPADEGAFDVVLELSERGGLRWSRAVATRTVQLLALSEAPFDPPDVPWSIVYELDPGSPKLLERLRRMPGMGLPSLPVPSITLPKMPKPSFALPKMPLPTAALPNMPLPTVPKLPSVATMVPRLTGLLAVGHSTLESHDLGPMLRLPPAATGPAWEAVALPAAEPGMPHLVEVDYPLEQEMVLGLAVLEEAAGEVRATASSGIDLRLPVIGAAGRHGRIGTRRFVFWPRTRAPLLVLTNLSARSPALFGKVRVLTGPGAVAARQPPVDNPRRLYVHVGDPDFTRFGAAERVDAASGQAAADWNAFLGAARRSADQALAQGAAGALVGVYADGAALWPTARACYAPRWDSGSSFAGGLDPTPKDVLDLICRVYARERLGLVPAIVCNGPVPELDALIAAGDGAAAGVVAVGRDGRPLATEGDRSPQYNILDPRVQAAVEALVAELVDRTRTAPAIHGVAIVLPHDGWLHCPGVAAGLDDTTFARFVATVGGDVEPLARPALGTGDARRFAARAALVEGPLRERWLTWREGVVAAFHGRLADLVAGGNAAWNLHLIPSTLFIAGQFAERFRPHLAAEPRDADVLREVGLDPARITAHGRIVYVSPHVHGTGDDVAERGTLQQANRSLPLMRGVAGATRVGALLLEQPLDVDVRDITGHASFTAKPSGPIPVVALAGGVEARRSLAEALIATDAEVVFDAGLVHACVDEDDERCRQALGVLPPPPLGMVPGVPAPLVVRARAGEAGLWVSIVNASGSPCEAVVTAGSRPAAVADAVTKAALPLGPAGEVAIPLAAWEVRTVVLEGVERIAAVRAVHDAGVGRAVADVLADLRERRAALEMPAPLSVLDNPAFDLPVLDGLVPGWELVEAGRGTLAPVPGKPSVGGNGLAFSSDNGLATLRSNPFAAPDTGRISIAMWVRAAGTDVQPPLRIAIEGVLRDREFYRFAPVGRGPGAMPLSAAWSQFVLQVDDLPTRGLDALRVRLDLLGPGAVEIDEVRVFDLAFDESQRVRLSKILSVAEERSAAGDVGGCLMELDGPWPRFLRSHVTAVPAEVAGDTPPGPAAGPDAQPPRNGVIDRVRRWWQ